MSGHRLQQDLYNTDLSITDPGDGQMIPVDRDLLYVGLDVGAATETRTLLAPLKPGLNVTLCLASTEGL